jgi:group I intron endonuclease
MYLHKKYYYLYKITNLLNKKVYIGVHSTNNLNDNYMGSGKGIKHAIKKYGLDNFQKEILEYFNNSDSMFQREKDVVNEDFVKDSNTYNNVLGGNKPPVGRKVGSTLTADVKEKIRQANIGKKYSPEINSKKGARKKDHWTYGKPRSAETKQKLREANLGKKDSEDTRIKKSLATKGIPKLTSKCPHCGKEGGVAQLKQWHFDKCKNKEIK